MIRYGINYNDVIDNGKTNATDVDPSGSIYYADVKSFIGVEYISGEIQTLPG